jgi:flagellar motor protein MotB
MRRRNSINIWPAFADLMTVLAVVGLFTALTLSRSSAVSEKDLVSRMRDLERTRQDLEKDLEAVKQEHQARETNWNQERKGLQQQVREAARNEKMFQAIQEAQRFIDDISHSSGLSFGEDQSLQFGDDLVSFSINGQVPIWKSDSRDRLRRFCEAISFAMNRLNHASIGGKPLFVVEVEGHADSTSCSEEPSCNWRFSSGRAAAFVALMRQSGYCPGGNLLALKPVGYADTRPPRDSRTPTRRIAVRLLPDYESIISSLSGKQ